MNAKAERIEHLIQVINRNLLLIYNGQIDGVIPLEGRSSSRIDTSVFNSDKFGYEMIKFVKSYVKNQKLSLPAIWERNFVKGLETLIIECAVVKDDIERECFVSRVYVWFTDKLIERRSLPDANKDTVGRQRHGKRLGGSHSLRASSGNDQLDITSAGSPPRSAVSNDGGEITLTCPPITPLNRGEMPMQGYPEVVPDDMALSGGGTGGYQPETEAELIMQELWIARRRQEAFEWKAKQNVALIMDRRALHKSRLESDTLRREESSSFLAGKQNPENISEKDYYDESTRYAPPMRRPLSGRKHFANVIVDAENNEDIQSTKDSLKSLDSVTNLRATGDGATVQSKGSRSTSEKKEVVPMRFKIEAPEGFPKSRKNSKPIEQQYFRLRPPPPIPAPPSVPPTKRSSSAPATGKPPKTEVKNSNVPKLFAEISHMDNELQVHYQFSRFRKIPMTEEQQAWLQSRENDRAQQYREYIAKLTEMNAAPENKSTKKGGKNKTAKAAKATVTKPKVPPPPPKYASAAEFMQKHFPCFDSEEYPDAQGTLRCHQLEECNRVYEALEKHCPGVDMTVIEKALVTPQDRNEAICLENMKDPIEGLMVNPLPKEYWRKMPEKKAKRRKGKKGKKVKS